MATRTAQEEPYDPDYSVQEALRDGDVISMRDILRGRLSRAEVSPCSKTGTWYVGGYTISVFCSRETNHTGQCAFVGTFAAHSYPQSVRNVDQDSVRVHGLVDRDHIYADDGYDTPLRQMLRDDMMRQRLAEASKKAAESLNRLDTAARDSFRVPDPTTKKSYPTSQDTKKGWRKKK